MSEQPCYITTKLVIGTASSVEYCSYPSPTLRGIHCPVRATLAMQKTKVGNRHNAKQCSVLDIVGTFDSPFALAVGTTAMALGVVLAHGLLSVATALESVLILPKTGPPSRWHP